MRMLFVADPHYTLLQFDWPTANAAATIPSSLAAIARPQVHRTIVPFSSWQRQVEILWKAELTALVENVVSQMKFEP